MDDTCGISYFGLRITNYVKPKKVLLFTFCGGTRPPFLVIPQTSKVGMVGPTIPYKSIKQARITVLYQVTDAGYLFHTKLIFYPQLHMASHSLFMIHVQKRLGCVQTFHVFVTKLFQLQIVADFERHNVTLYDGPDKSCDQIYSPDGRKGTTSTFQAVIKVGQVYCLVTNTSLTKFNISYSELASIKVTKATNLQTEEMYEGFCKSQNQTVCVLHFSVPEKRYINFTLSLLVFMVVWHCLQITLTGIQR